MNYLIPEVLLILAALCVWRYRVINSRVFPRYFLVSYAADVTIRGCCAISVDDGVFKMPEIIGLIADKNKFTNVTITSVFETTKKEFELSGPDLAKGKYENI